MWKRRGAERGGRADRKMKKQRVSLVQKRGVPRLHGNMLPGNSFPQICVVSRSIMWILRERHKSTYVLWFKVM
jgi:hypothetical protein